MQGGIIFILIFSLVTGFFGFSQNLDAIQYGSESGGYSIVNFKGKVIRANSNEELVGVTLRDTVNNVFGITNEYGLFSIQVTPGFYRFELNSLGYTSEVFNVRVLGPDNLLFISLEPRTINLEQVVVQESQADQNISNNTAGITQLTMDDVQRSGKFLGENDVLRSLASVSGVSSVGEGASGLNVRGGNADENLILQDYNLIFNPNHALGLFSLFHPDLVNNVTLYKGGQPARYGGRLSSVLDVQLREGNQERLQVKGGVGIATSRLVLEGPIKKDVGSFVVGGRVSYINWLLKRADNPNVNESNAFFYDLTAKADYRISKTTKLGFSGFWADDDFQFSNEVKFDYLTSTISGYIKQLIGDRINLTARINVGSYTSSLFDVRGNDQSEYQNQIDYIRGGLFGFIQWKEKVSTEIGVEVNDYQMQPGEIEPLNEFSTIVSDVLATEKGREYNAFIQNQLRLSERFEIGLGLRYTLYHRLGPDQVTTYQEETIKSEVSSTGILDFGDNEKIAAYSGLEPRISFLYKLTDESSIKGGYNRSFQYLSQISNTASATPINIWQLSDYHLRPQQADNYSIGYYRNFKQNTFESSVDLFYRKIEDLIDYKDFAELLLNKHIETDLVTGTGKAYGVELLVHKSKGKHQYELNYTYSRSLRQIPVSSEQKAINGGSWYPSNYDKPHVLNANYLINFDNKTSLSFNFTYSTGRPTTAPVSSYSFENLLNIPVYSDRNQFRIPDYHRLDVAYNIGPWGKRPNQEHSITLSIYNLYARKNAFSVFFRQSPSQKITPFKIAVLGTIFPAITYNFKL